MTMGPEPRTRIFEMSVRFGIDAVSLLNSGSTASAPLLRVRSTGLGAAPQGVPLQNLGAQHSHGRGGHSALHPLHSANILVNSLNKCCESCGPGAASG